MTATRTFCYKELKSRVMSVEELDPTATERLLACDIDLDEILHLVAVQVEGSRFVGLITYHVTDRNGLMVRTMENHHGYSMTLNGRLYPLGCEWSALVRDINADLWPSQARVLTFMAGKMRQPQLAA